MTDRTITTTGVGRERGSPKEARITVRVEGNGSSPTQARDRAAGRTDDVASAVERAVAATVRPTDLRVDRPREGFDPDPDAPSCRWTRTLTVVTDPASVGDAVVAAAEAGGRVDEVTFALDTVDRERLETRARTAATAAARERAEAILAQEDSIVGRLAEARETDPDDEHGSSGLVEEALDTADSPTINPEPVTVTAGVRATFHLREPTDEHV